MLKILQRYLAKSVFSATALAAVVITALLFVMTLLGEFKSIGEGDYGFIAALAYVFLRMPNSLYQFSPMLILMGSIIGLSLLSSNRELAVMRASGFSMNSIIRSILMASLLLIMCISVVGELFGPSLNHKAEVYKDNLQNAGKAVVTSAGIWLHIDQNFILVDHVVDNDLLEGVTRYQFDDDHRLQAAYYAKTMKNQNGRWVMHDAVKTTFSGDRTRSESFDELPLELSFNNHMLSTGKLEPSEMTLPKLMNFASYLEKNGLQSSQFRFEFWTRVFMPFASLIMVFLAIPFVLSVFRQSAMGWRLMAGLLAGVLFFIFNALFGQLSIVYQVPPGLAALIPILLFAGIGLVLSRKALTT